MSQFTYSAFRARRDKLFLVSAVIAAALCFAFFLSYFAAAAGTVRDSVVRLHILAQSDTAQDQAVKLAVRDAILEENSALVSGKLTKENADEVFRQSEKTLRATADRVLAQKHCPYRAQVRLVHEYYPTRVYGDLTFPAGVYTSVKVVLGEGAGHNWWCVLFPPLCVPAASGEVALSDGTDPGDYLTQSGEKIVSSGKKYRVGFKLLEWYEKWCGRE